MTKKVLILYTNTTGLHNNNIDAVSKKNLYQYARLIQLSYTINSYNNNKSVNILPTLSHIIKPHTININGSAKFHNISQELADEKGIDIYDVLNEFITNLKMCDIIVAHNANHHLKTILAEAVRFNISIDISKHIVIDTSTFFHDYTDISLEDLAKKLKIKLTLDKVELINLIFIKLYKQFEDSIKTV